MTRLTALAAPSLLISALLLIAPDGLRAQELQQPTLTPSTQVSDGAPLAATPDRTTAKGEIAHQMGLIKAGKTKELAARFTKRLRPRITEKALKAGQAELRKLTIDDLVHTLIPKESYGQKTIKIKMKNGRTLTTLVEDGKGWLADTIWFK